MSVNQTHNPPNTILLIGASRGLGYAMAVEFLNKGWNVVGTVRTGGRTKLHDLADRHKGRVEIETLEIREPDQIAALRARLSGREFDILFVNTGVTNNPEETIADVTTDEFIRVMITNSLSPMRVIESLQDLVSPRGLIGVMSSGQGSVSNNETGMREVYRGSKAARNGIDGSRLGPHRHGRSRCKAYHRRKRSEPSKSPSFEAGQSRFGISRLSWPHGPLVICSAPLRR
jgi:NAD(P)-dependent dehydrogenase (short-subunit alcohol dehydrogenase family)